jgi:hypothetical protein
MQQHAGKKRSIGEMAALLQDVMHGPVFVGGEGIQRVVRHSVLRAERCAEYDQTTKEGFAAYHAFFCLENRSTLNKL